MNHRTTVISADECQRRTEAIKQSNLEYDQRSKQPFTSAEKASEVTPPPAKTAPPSAGASVEEAEAEAESSAGASVEEAEAEAESSAGASVEEAKAVGPDVDVNMF